MKNDSNPYSEKNPVASSTRGNAKAIIIFIVIIAIFNSSFYYNQYGNIRFELFHDISGIVSWLAIACCVYAILYALAEIIQILHDIRKNQIK